METRGQSRGGGDASHGCFEETRHERQTGHTNAGYTETGSMPNHGSGGGERNSVCDTIWFATQTELGPVCIRTCSNRDSVYCWDIIAGFGRYQKIGNAVCVAPTAQQVESRTGAKE